MKTIKDLLENAPQSKWKEEAKWRAENREWLDKSFSITIKLLQHIRLNNSDKETVKILLGIDSGDIFKGKYKYTEEELLRVKDLILCPKCDYVIIEKWSGIKCSNKKCNYWSCI